MLQHASLKFKRCVSSNNWAGAFIKMQPVGDSKATPHAHRVGPLKGFLVRVFRVRTLSTGRLSRPINLKGSLLKP